MKNAMNLILTVLIACVFVIGFTEPAHAITTITFTDLTEQRITQVDFNLIDELINLNNSTGVTWTDFHFRLALSPDSVGDFRFPENGGVPIDSFDGTAYEGPGTPAYNTGFTTLDVTGLNISDGADYSFNIDLWNINVAGEVELFGQPTTDRNGVPVPEPGTIILFGIGLAGIIGLRRKRSLPNH